MSEVPERRVRPRWVGLGMAALPLPGYARPVCFGLGLDAAWAEARLVAESRRPHVVGDLRIASGIQGCEIPLRQGPQGPPDPRAAVSENRRSWLMQLITVHRDSG